MGDLMRADERWPAWTGTVTVITRDRRGRFTSRRTFRNLITNAGLNLLRDALGGFVTDAQIHYVAIGTSGTAPAAGDTQLGAEVYRKAVTRVDNTVGTGQVKTTLLLAPTDSAGTAIAEIGWFAGASATATANSGVLVAHVLYSHTHTNQESIQIDRTDTL